jgi:hypothetical protein
VRPYDPHAWIIEGRSFAMHDWLVALSLFGTPVGLLGFIVVTGLLGWRDSVREPALGPVVKPPRWQHFRTRVRRSPGWTAAAVLCVLSALTFAVVAFVQHTDPLPLLGPVGSSLSVLAYFVCATVWVRRTCDRLT